jgi:hypothetical protein
VAGVGEESEGVRDEAAHELHDHEAGRQEQDDPQHLAPAPALVPGGAEP